MACPATARLHHKAQYEQGLDQRIVARSPHFALHGPASRTTPEVVDMQTALIGAVIPKRWAKRAVTRNALRRQIHEVWLEWSGRLPVGICVVRLRQSIETTRFASATSMALKQAVRAELNQLFSQWATS